MARRGWIEKVYNDGKLLCAKIRSGEWVENDELDVIQPVGLNAHVKPSEKCEALTLDIGGDTSRRVIMNIFGDREEHPQPDEGEAFLYSPGDKKIFQRIKKKTDKQQSQQTDGQGQSKRQTKESGREAGVHWDAKDQKGSGKTESNFMLQADAGQGYAAKNGNFDIEVGKNTQFQASKHVRRGVTYRDQTEYVGGVVHAANVRAGASVNVSPRSQGRAAGAPGAAEGPDGKDEWQVNATDGTVGLLETAQQLMQTVGQVQAQQQQIAELLQRVAQLEQVIAGMTP